MVKTFLSKVILLGMLLASPAHSLDSPVWCTDILSLNLPIVPQTLDYTCGVACLDSALRFWRAHSPGEIMLARLLGTNPLTGTDGPAIVNAARAYGLYSIEQGRTTIADLHRYLLQQETVIVAWQPNGSPHYSLLRGLGVHHVTLMDPWHARKFPGHYRTLSIPDFLWEWNNGINLFGSVIRIAPHPLLP